MDLIGLENARQFFTNAEKSTLPRAMIVSGKSGIGKFSLMAQQAARLLGVAHTPRAIKELIHPDLYLVSQGSIKVDNIRAIQQFNQNQPSQASYKIVLIDNAETMNDNASNALLKLLEEIKPSLFVWLVTSNYHTLLPTIRSRCHHLRVSPLGTAQTIQILQSSGISEENAKLLALLSNNSPGLALKLAHTELPALWKIYWQCLAAPDSAAKLSSWYDKLLSKDNQELWNEWPQLFTNFAYQLLSFYHHNQYGMLEIALGNNHPFLKAIPTLNGNYLLQHVEEVISILQDLTTANLGEKVALTLVSTKLSQMFNCK